MTLRRTKSLPLALVSSLQCAPSRCRRLAAVAVEETSAVPVQFGVSQGDERLDVCFCNAVTLADIRCFYTCMLALTNHLQRSGDVHD